MRQAGMPQMVDGCGILWYLSARCLYTR